MNKEIILKRLKVIKQNTHTSIGYMLCDRNIISLINRGFKNNEIEFFAKELFLYFDNLKYWQDKKVK